MALVVVDAAVIIAFLNPHDHNHQRAVAAFRARRSADLVIPTSVLAEILVGPYRRDQTAVSQVEAFIGDAGIQVEPIDRAIAKRAAFLRARNVRLRLPDALVLATGDVREAAAVLTADKSWAKISKRVEVI